MGCKHTPASTRKTVEREINMKILQLIDSLFKVVPLTINIKNI